MGFHAGVALIATGGLCGDVFRQVKLPPATSVIKLELFLSVRLKVGVPAAHNDGSPEKTQQQEQEMLQPGEGDVTSFCLCGLWSLSTRADTF